MEGDPSRIRERGSNLRYDYEGTTAPVAFTGTVLFGSGFIQELYVHMGFHPAWKYERAIELRCRGGILEEALDRSPEMAVRRRNRARGLLSPRADDEEETLRWIEYSFGRDLDA